MNLSNFCANLKMGWLYKKSLITISHTNLNKKALQLLWILGYIQGFYIYKKYKISVVLKWRTNFLKSILIISKPGRRVFCNVNNLNKLIKLNKGIYFLSTNKGLLTHKGCLFWRVGGELLCIIY